MCIALDGKDLDDIIFKTKEAHKQNKMTNIVLSLSKIKFWIRSTLPFFIDVQNLILIHLFVTMFLGADIRAQFDNATNHKVTQRCRREP